MELFLVRPTLGDRPQLSQSPCARVPGGALDSSIGWVVLLRGSVQGKPIIGSPRTIVTPADAPGAKYRSLTCSHLTCGKPFPHWHISTIAMTCLGHSCTFRFDAAKHQPHWL